MYSELLYHCYFAIPIYVNIILYIKETRPTDGGRVTFYDQLIIKIIALGTVQSLH